MVEDPDSIQCAREGIVGNERGSGITLVLADDDGSARIDGSRLLEIVSTRAEFLAIDIELEDSGRVLPGHRNAVPLAVEQLRSGGNAPVSGRAIGTGP